MKRYLPVVLVIIIAIAIILFSYFDFMNSEMGPGTAYEFRPVEGCELVNNLDYGSNITITDEILDNLIVEYGYGRSGYNTSTYREYCTDNPAWFQDFENCVKGYTRTIRVCCETPDSQEC